MLFFKIVIFLKNFVIPQFTLQENLFSRIVERGREGERERGREGERERGREGERERGREGEREPF